MAAILIKDLHKSYGQFEAVRGIDVTVEEGEVFGLLGPNGAGKTTTVEILEGYRELTSGSVEVLGVDPSTGGREFRQRVGIVLQECGFPRFSTVAELLELQGDYYPNPRPVSEVINVIGLDDKANARVGKLSGGQKRRLDLGLALMGDPELIFLDEPTTGFDPTARRGAWDVIRNLKTLGKTILLTTHYMDEAQQLADRVAVISAGRIVAEGTPESIGGRDKAKSEIAMTLPSAGLTGFDNVVEPEWDVVNYNGRIVIQTESPTKALNALTNWALSNNVDLHDLSVSRPTLEDIYLRLTADDPNTVGAGELS